MGNRNSNCTPLSIGGRIDIIGNYTPILSDFQHILKRSIIDRSFRNCATHVCTNSAENNSPICKPCNKTRSETFKKTPANQFLKNKNYCANTTHCNQTLGFGNRHSCLFCQHKVCGDCFSAKKIVHSKRGVVLTTNYCCDSCYTSLNKDISTIKVNIFLKKDVNDKQMTKSVNYVNNVVKKLHNKNYKNLKYKYITNKKLKYYFAIAK